MMRMIMIVVSVALIICVCGCTQPELPDMPSTDPLTASATEPTTHHDPIEQSGTPVDAETLRFFEQEILPYPSWYNMILTTQFSAPEDADLYLIFYNGIGENGEVAGSTELTQEEIDCLVGLGYEMEYAYSRISVDRMNSVLLRYLGISFEESNKRGLENFIYLESTGCYYHQHTDANILMDFTVESGYSYEDGTIHLYYSTGKNSNPRFAESCVVVLRTIQNDHGNTYQIVSNQTMD